MGPESQQGGGEWATPGNDTGDIILTPSEPVKKPLMSRGLLIGVIVSVVVIIVLAILAVNSLQGGKILGNSGAESGENAFYSYANYMINGSTKAVALEGEYTEGMETAFTNTMYDDDISDEDKLAFLNTASELLGKFTAENDNFGEYVSVFQLVKAYHETDILDEDEILALYLNNERNVDSVYTYIDSNYMNIDTSESEDLRSYLADLIEYNKLLAEKYDRYNATGCMLDDGGLDSSCMDRFFRNNDPEEWDGEERINDLDVKLEVKITWAENYVLGRCWAIESELRGDEAVEGEDDAEEVEGAE